MAESPVISPKPASASASAAEVLPAPLGAQSSTTASSPGSDSAAAWTSAWPDSPAAASTARMPGDPDRTASCPGATPMRPPVPEAAMCRDSRPGTSSISPSAV